MVRDKNRRIIEIATILGVFGLIILVLSFVPGILNAEPNTGTYVAVAAGAILIPCSIFIAASLIMKKIDEKFNELKK